MINVITNDTINVLTDNDKDLLKSLDSIKNKDIQELIIKQLLGKEDKKEYSTSTDNTQLFNLQDVFSRFSKEKPITTQDLKEELKQTKKDIKEIKERLSKLEKEKSSSNPLPNPLLNTPENSNRDDIIGKIGKIFLATLYP